MKMSTRGQRCFAVSTVVLTCLALQAVFTLPVCGDEIVGWGEDLYGQATPPVGNDFTAVVAGARYSLALKTDGSIVGWGNNYYGQATPPAGNDFTAIAASLTESYALKSDGSIVVWGLNYSGRNTPPAGNDFTAVSAGVDHCLALKSDGSIAVWGDNYYGQVVPQAGNNFTAVAAGAYHNLALKSDGSIIAWGRDNCGQTTAPAGNDFIAIATGWYHNLALRADGSIFGWGDNRGGQTNPQEGNDFAAVATGLLHSLALKSDGSIVAWGNNASGQRTPPAGNDFTAVSAGWYHCLALVSQNTPPVAHAGGPYLVAVGQEIMLDGSGSDDPDGDVLSYFWTQDEDLGDFDDDTLESPSFTGVTAGVTNLELWVGDGVDIALDSTMLVVYDPSGGFVTGGGWINSPAGAYAADTFLEGKANFGFVSKYKKGAKVPTGNTEFIFRAAGLNFHSSSYQWLVVNQGGANAQFKGTGTINGEGNYKFMLWAGDGEPDTFRIKIWEELLGEEIVYYDNDEEQTIGGGNIIVHKK